MDFKSVFYLLYLVQFWILIFPTVYLPLDDGAPSSQHTQETEEHKTHVLKRKIENRRIIHRKVTAKKQDSESVLIVIRHRTNYVPHPLCHLYPPPIVRASFLSAKPSENTDTGNQKGEKANQVGRQPNWPRRTTLVGLQRTKLGTGLKIKNETEG